tara:strand:+ start:45 stop:1796 length:1752 start_codon:yes stop_codon:yes gene_type:complete
MTYNPREDDKVYIGTQLLDNIENGVIGSMEWLQNQAKDDPDRYTDDMLRLLGGGVKNIGWAISKIPFLDKIAQGEDWLAGKAREMSAELTPWLDPRFAGWGTRVGTGILADKGISKGLKVGTAAYKHQKYLGKARKLGLAVNPNQRLALNMMADIDDLSPNYTGNFQSNAPIANLGSRGFKQIKELIEAGIDPQYGDRALLYNYPKLPDGSDFLWAGKRTVEAPTPKGVPVDLGDGLIRSKNDIDLSTFDFSNPAKASRDFEDLIRQSLEIDQITKKHLVLTGRTRNKLITNATGEEAIGIMWNDYLAGYFDKFIRSGKATNFKDAISIKLPGGRVLKGDSGLARELRLWFINPEAIDVGSGFTKRGARPKRKEYRDAIRKAIDTYTEGGLFQTNPKFEAHHIRVIEQEWPTFIGLSTEEVGKMRVLHKKHSKYPAGNAKGNRFIVLDELHDKIHDIYWKGLESDPIYSRYWDIIEDPNFTTLYPTAESREFLVKMFHEMIEDMMNNKVYKDIDRILKKLHIKKLYGLNMDDAADALIEISDELELDRYRSIERAFDEDWGTMGIGRETTQSEIDDAFGKMQN